MCVVSMIMDHYGDKWDKLPKPTPWVVPVIPAPLVPPNTEPPITDAEIREFRELLERAREYDRKNSEPDCELQEKKDRVKKLAEELGVQIDFL